MVQRQGGSRALMAMECVISYHTFGTVESGVDRGRTLAALDTELLSICQPEHDIEARLHADAERGSGDKHPLDGPGAGQSCRQRGADERGAAARRPRECGWNAARALTVFFFPEVNFL